MEKGEAFNFLCRVAQGIAIMFGPSCETLIHDMSVPKHPILAIYNNQVSNRDIGSTEDIFGEKDNFDPIILSGDRDYVNHLAITRTGKHVKSSTFHIRGQDFHYALGINYDFTAFIPFNRVIADLMSVGTELGSEISLARETHLSDIFDECLASIGIPIDEMKKKDRLRLVALLDQKNAFSFQKSVPFISEKLNLSRYTVYKYIKEVVENEPSA